ncbi:Ribosomal protein L2 family [Hibiscus syriacus]|uniref:Ribosomal protein L2 family n=1 Tax=Hibiscus syriacus TaxID=106335 RepID=A0A6A2ZPQ9_HIBSY|nr:filament-like plant protein 5 [Hibiscus syriacus]KAE8694011.1 Ribosomal protein L2 family [Hibiscus syriacus]
MDRRGWPWKKKSSEKSGTEKQVVVSDGTGASLSSLASLGDQEKCKKVNYVQISMESYLHLTGLEDEVNKLKDQVRLFEDEVKDLEGKLSEAHSEIKSKDALIIQHAKVAEEAVSGWEKADAEAIALKRQLENLTLLKLSVEDRAEHLDGALKECMRQVRDVKEESEQKLQDLVLAKRIQFEKIKLGLESKIAELDEGLLRAEAENQALSRSLHEQSNLIVQIKVEKSKAESEIELMKENLMSREKEISLLKYELHMASKELEIRNEEKNLSIRSAEAANKQHLASVGKIAKLEAECQRLRSLVRKRLPGPAALAQMKHEIDHLGRDFGGPQSKRNVAKNPNSNLSPQMESSAGNLLQSQKEIDYLTMRLLEMEEETKMLKEALTSRNSELQAARERCAKTNLRVKSLEAQAHALNYQTSSPKSSIGHPAGDLSSQYASNAPSITSISEDGIDVEGRLAESLLPATSNISHLGMEKNSHKVDKQEKSNCLELMDDFLEMEKLACLSNDVGGVNAVSIDPDNSKQEFGFSPSSKQGSSSARSSTTELQKDVENLPFQKLQSMVFTIFESQTKEKNLGKVLEDIKCAILEVQGSLSQHLVNYIYGGVQLDYGPSDQKDVSGESLIFLEEDNITKQKLASAISQIHQVLLSVGREAMRVQDPRTDGHGLSKKLDYFSVSVDKFVFDKKGLVDFILKLSHVLAEVDRLNLGFLGFRDYDRNASDNECIDKVALLENKVVQDNPSKHASGGGYHLCHSCPDSEVLQDEISDSSFQPNATSSCLLKELKQLKLDKANMAVDLERSTEDLENTKLLLQETENRETELKSQLASSQNLHSLAETQLKCMTESYKSLEARTQELEAEINLFQEKAAKLDDKLQEEKRGHQDALARCKDLEDQIQRNAASFLCPKSAIEDSEVKIKQEREIKDAAQKLAACQVTIFLLGRQLQSLHTQSDKLLGESSVEDRLNHSGSKSQDIHCTDDLNRIETDSVTSAGLQSMIEDNETNLSLRSSLSSSHLDNRHTKSTFSASTLEQEKHPLSFGQIFSLKGKNEP